jgi:hypothetical protein
LAKCHLTLAAEEMSALRATNHRPYLIAGWIQKELVRRAKQGKVDAAPPVLSRSFQVMSEVQLAMNQAQKIQTTPFPFPFVQVRPLMESPSGLEKRERTARRVSVSQCRSCRDECVHTVSSSSAGGLTPRPGDECVHTVSSSSAGGLTPRPGTPWHRPNAHEGGLVPSTPGALGSPYRAPLGGRQHPGLRAWEGSSL